MVHNIGIIYVFGNIMRTNLSNVVNFILIQQTFIVCYMKKTTDQTGEYKDS